MAIYRGIGGAGDSTTDATVTAVTEQATDAAQSASDAAESASSAASSAASASSSASNAASNATSASQSATDAASYVTATQTAATQATNAEVAAEGYAEDAEASALAAAGSASSAATSATASANSATAAATSESNAASSATAAASSASTASTAADTALAALDSFDDRYLGQKASNPTLDNDGNALLSGALYFNTTDDVMKVYDGAQWLAAYAQLSGALIAANNLSDVVNVTAARTNLGLGTAATTASTDYATAAQGALADSALQSFTETDPVYTASSWYTTTNNSTNWDTAYGWGDHALEGYLTSYTETDPVFTAWDKSTGISITEAQISDFGSYETAFSKNTAFNKNFGTTSGTVAQGNDSRINNGQTAYGWGDHALEGYITDYTVTEADVTAHQAALSITESQISDLSHYTDSDVDTHLNTSTATTDQYLGWNGSDYAWSTISGYTDSDVDTHLNSSTATTDQLLSWSGTDYSWIDAPSGGGGATLELYAENPSTPTAPSATGTNAVAIGTNAVASGLNAMAFGEGSTASADESIALSDSTASGVNSIAIGQNALALGTSSTSIGSGSDARSTGSTAIGYNSQAHTGTNATALTNSYASGTDSFAAAIANNFSSYGATGANSIAIGRYNKATNSGSVAVGREYNTSSGVGSIVLGGGSNNSTGAYSVTSGYANTASASYTWATGQYASAAIIGKSARASGRFSVKGDAQSGHFVLRADTTDATAEALTTNNSTAGITNQIILPNNSACSFSGTIIARQQAASGPDFAAWEIKGGAVRDGAGGLLELGSYNINILSKSVGASAWDVALSADTINGGIAITVTGAAATNIRWVATVNTSEVTYA